MGIRYWGNIGGILTYQPLPSATGGRGAGPPPPRLSAPSAVSSAWSSVGPTNASARPTNGGPARGTERTREPEGAWGLRVGRSVASAARPRGASAGWNGGASAGSSSNASSGTGALRGTGGLPRPSVRTGGTLTTERTDVGTGRGGPSSRGPRFSGFFSTQTNRPGDRPEDEFFALQSGRGWNRWGSDTETEGRRVCCQCGGSDAETEGRRVC